MALGKYTRVDNRRSSSSYCSTVTIVVFVALCLVGVWMMTSSSVVPVQNVDIPQENKSEVKEQVIENNNEVKEQANENVDEVKEQANENVDEVKELEKNDSNTSQFEDNPGDLPEDATKGDTNDTPSQSESDSNSQENQEQKKDENVELKTGEDSSAEETKSKDNESNEETDRSKTDGGDDDSGVHGDSEEGAGEKKSDTDETEKKTDSDESSADNRSEEKVDGEIEEKVSQNGNDGSGDNSDEKKDESQTKDQTPSEVFPSGAQSDLLNETTTQNGAFSTQAAESKNEKESQGSSKQQTGYSWKLCNVTAGPDYIPCLDNLRAIKSLSSTKHYEHRERHCPENPPTCVVALPKGYRKPIEWPTSREKIWYYNVPHTKLAEVKGHQNWVKVTGEYLTFPGGGTQFKYGALHYIDFIQESVPDVAWGKRSRVILDVGCGVASFGGYLFDRDVLAMSLAPKDEHEAQVQFALERGIPALSAVMGTTRLPFPSRVFDIVHCARCRVPWHIEGGKLLLELNRLLRPGGFFVWSATPVYQKKPEDVAIWKAMSELIKSMCWELISINKDSVNGVGVATYRKPMSNDCYDKRSQNNPPMCADSDDSNAAWYVPLQTCMHKIPIDSTERGSQWPEEWPARLVKTPYWLLSSQVGVYGKSAPEDFASDNEHWKRVVTKSYLSGIGIDWSTVRNVMDMRAIYGGFAAALKDLNVWVMNVVSIDAPDTLPIIYERGLFGIYHDWCESFSTYPRSYDLLHADHLFSKNKKRCNLVALVAEVDRILRPGGKLIVRDDVETINEVESMARAMQWEVRLTYSKDNEGLLCVQKSMWRPSESETISYAIA